MEPTSEDKRMKRQKELAIQVNKEAMKRFQDHKDEQVSKRYVRYVQPLVLDVLNTTGFAV